MWSLGEAIPLETLLQPPPDAAQESIRLSTHSQCLSGWVEQGSPCCAAASIAGAFNALCKLDVQGEGEAASGATSCTNSCSNLSSLSCITRDSATYSSKSSAPQGPTGCSSHYWRWSGCWSWCCICLVWGSISLGGRIELRLKHIDFLS